MRLLLTAFLLSSVIVPVAPRQQTGPAKDSEMTKEIKRGAVSRGKKETHSWSWNPCAPSGPEKI